MRILFVHNAYQQAGGEDAVVRAEVALLRRHGHEVRTYWRSNDELLDAGHARAGLSAIWSRRTAQDIENICALFAPDVIHVHNTFFVVSPSVYWAAARYGAALVQTLHNFRLLCPQGTFLRNGKVCEDCLNKKPWRAVTRRCYRGSALQSSLLAGVTSAHAMIGTYRRQVTRYIALSGFARGRFIEGGLPAASIRIKPNFVNVSVAPGRNTARRGGLFVGRLSVEKGIEVLLDAMRILDDADIRIVGDGPCAGAVATQVGDAHLGLLASDEVAAQMRSAAFLVLPSTGHEQMPMTVLEAFAHGLPVIASRLGAMADIVRDGVTGLLAEPGNPADLAAKIDWARAHPERLQAMGEAARADYESKYTASINYQLLMDIYEDAIAATRGRGHPAQGRKNPRYLDRCLGLGRSD
ncbi:glycosyltransferase family 4 protein [Massilia sp. LXY-6]|uniref:glycosyltransferase family 4 protein n=1 Tax=Massilia sp. LXY-6 TaxID=3379823 RepID=UPI003EE2A30C